MRLLEQIPPIFKIQMRLLVRLLGRDVILLLTCTHAWV